MHQVLAVKESQGVQGGKQHFPYFFGSEGSLRKNLRESLFGVFHHDEEILETSELATARLEKSNQMRMGEGGRRRPMRKLCLRESRNSRDQLERGIGKVFCLIFGKEYRTMVRGAQKAAEGKDSIDDLAFPLRPDLSHR